MRRPLAALFLAITCAAPAHAALTFETNPSDLSRWWNTDVSVTITASDPAVASITCDGVTPPVNSPTSPLTFIVTQEGETTVQCRASDGAGNILAETTLPVIKIDRTPPVINRELINQPEYNDGTTEWFNQMVRYRALSFDMLSGLSGGGAQEVWFTGEGGGQRTSFRFDDHANNCAILSVGPYTPDPGNCVVTTLPQVGLDFTRCTANVRISPTPNAAGWNNTAITIFWEVTDSGSGMNTTGRGGYENPLQSFTTAAEGIFSITKRFSDNVMLECSATIVWRIDRTPPTIDVSQVPPKNANGWNNTDVNVHMVASDDRSGMAGPTTFDSFHSTGGQTIAQFITEDVAGNRVGRNHMVSIDKTPPFFIFQRFPNANAAGWNRTPFEARFTALDSVSGFTCAASPSGCFAVTQSIPVNTETAGLTLNSSPVSDQAGNPAAPMSAEVKLDKTPPVVTHTRTPGPNANGWNNTDVTIQFDGVDALSGIVGDRFRDFILSSSFANQGAQTFYFDQADNRAEGVVTGINIDKNKPVVISNSQPSANVHGWNNTDVTVNFTATDQTIFGSDRFASILVTGEGTNFSARQTFTDLAGNSTTAERSGINIDKTRPVVTATPLTAPNAHGWYNTDVTVRFEGTDGLSGMLDGPVDELVRASGDRVGVQRFLSDKAFNVGFGSVELAIDKNVPSVACWAEPFDLWPPRDQLVPITVQSFFDDGDEYVSGRSGGPDGGIILRSITSTVPRDGDIVGWDLGTPDMSGELRSFRSSSPLEYRLSYDARDFAGNVGRCEAFVAVMTPPFLPFAEFDGKLEVDAKHDQVGFDASFVLGAENDGLDPANEDLTLQIDTWSVVIPAGSLIEKNSRQWSFKGPAGGVSVDVKLKAKSGGFEIQIGVETARLLSVPETTTVFLIIGNDMGEGVFQVKRKQSRRRTSSHGG